MDEILKRVTAADSVYYHHDALGSVMALTNKAGNVIEQYTYDVFGSPTFKNATGDTLTASAFNNRFLYTGREYIKEIVLYDFRNRMYSHALGRFLQTDLLRFDARDLNIYRYVRNNPTNETDPEGLYGGPVPNQQEVVKASMEQIRSWKAAEVNAERYWAGKGSSGF